MANIMNIFKKKKPVDIQFIDTLGYPTFQFPIRLAKNEPLFFAEKQKELYGKMKFHLCPGMIDYARIGYIIPAWDHIKIKANKAGVVAFKARNKSAGSGDTQIHPMDDTLINGVFEPQGIPLKAFKLDSPWRIKTAKNISALLIPAVYHSKFLDDVFVVPGIVDYKTFSQANFIFSVKRECEVTIEPGEPLLHIIPFVNEEISASYGMATEIDSLIGNPVYKMIKHFYRKNDSEKKKHTLERRDLRDSEGA